MVATNIADEGVRKGKTVIWVDFDVRHGDNRVACDAEYAEVIKTLGEYHERSGA